ncbi:MAG: T9SS C-terminal target domain-containing protein [Balneola sp.]|nr:MAG: T9SS C-terminal target domain-containing protein [Balneola sp.]
MKKATSLFFLLFLSLSLQQLLLAQITIDGISDEPEYSTLATSNGNDGFGSTNTMDDLKYFADGEYIYIGIPGDLDSNNNYAIFLDFSGYDGTPAGDVVGESSTIGFFDDENFDGSKLDFEVDYAFGMNEGSTTTDFYVDAVRYGSTGALFQWDYLGSTGQDGTSTSLPSSDASIYNAGSLDVAYENSGGTDEGLEFRIKISEIPGIDSTQTVRLFAAIISGDGFWSDVLLPNEGYTGGNLGTDPDLGSLSGDFFTEAQSMQHSVEVTGDAGWRLLSFPITGATGADISDDGIGAQFTSNTDSATIYTYDDTGSFEAVSSDATTLTDGYGLAVYFFDNTDASSSELPITLDVPGSPPSSQVDVTLNTTAAGSTDGSGAATSKYTLVGNPFASNYDLNQMTFTGDGTQDNVHFWKNGSYTTGDKSSAYIVAPWQGFFVEVSSAQSTTALAFPTSGKTSSDTTATHFSKASEQRGDISFTLSSDDSYDEAIRMAFREYATEGFDRADASKLVPLSPTYATMAFKSETGLKSVESLPWDLTEEVTIELELQQVGVDGGFTFDWKGLETIPDEWQLTLHDYQEEVNIDMREETEYVFNSDAPNSKQINPLSIITGVQAVTQKSKSEDGIRFAITITPNTASVSNETGDDPITFELEQNYPNPFNPSTTINYTVASTGKVTLNVYNLMGQKVAELVNATKAAGSYNVSWDASGAASGMYIYRLEAGGQTLTRKMTLIK